MIGTRLAYFIWVRWSSGSYDVFQINEAEYRFHRKSTLRGTVRFSTPSGNDVVILTSHIVAYKFLTKRVSDNPLNDPANYDNPLN